MHTSHMDERMVPGTGARARTCAHAHPRTRTRFQSGDGGGMSSNSTTAESGTLSESATALSDTPNGRLIRDWASGPFSPLNNMLRRSSEESCDQRSGG